MSNPSQESSPIESNKEKTMEPRESRFKNYPNLTWPQFTGWVKDRLLRQHKLISSPFIRYKNHE